MTQAAMLRLTKTYVPAHVFLPAHVKLYCDTPQRGTDRYVGYRALWMKVIIRAAFDWVSYRDSTKLDKLKDAESGHRWIFEDSELFNSFETICQLVDLPLDKVRRWVLGLTKEHVAKIEHLERESGTNQVAIIEATRRHIAGLEDEDA
jgi:hypothetical protein